MTLYEYIDRIMKPQEPGVLGKGTNVIEPVTY